MSAKKIFKAVATVTVFSVITRTLSFLFKIYLSRTLGAEVVGLYHISISMFFLFSAISASGLPTVLSRKIAESRAASCGETAVKINNTNGSFVSAALGIGLALSVLTTICLLLLEPFLGKLFTDGRAVPMFLIMTPALITTSIYSILRGWFWGTKQFAHFSITEMIEEILRILFTLFFISGVMSGFNKAYGLAVAFTISDAAVALILIIMFFKKDGKLKKFDKDTFTKVAKPALPLTTMRIFASLTSTLIAIILPMRLVVSGMSTEDATASYGRIAGMAGPLLFAPNALIGALAVVLVPEMSESGVKKNNKELNRHINNGIIFSILMCGAFAAVYYALGKEITEFLFDDTLSGEYLKASSPILLIMPIYHMLSSAMHSIGMEKEAFFTFLISTVFMMMSVYFLTPYIGVNSVIVANVSMLIVSTIGNLYYLRKAINFDFGFIKTFVLVSLFVFPVSFMGRNIYSLLYGVNDVLALFAALIIAFGAYAALVSATGLIDIGGFIKTGLKFTKKKSDKATSLSANSE